MGKKESMQQTWWLLIATVFSLGAFAENSIFCRLALRAGVIAPDSFTALRLLSGAAFLLPLCWKTICWKTTGTRALGGTWRGGFTY